MNFAYSVYVRTCLVLPSIALLFALYIFVGGIFCFIKLIVNKKLVTKHIFIFMWGMLISIFFLWLHGRQLFLHGGIYLLSENESNAVEIQGEITELTRLDNFYFSVLKSVYSNETRGYIYTIEGVQYVAIDKGSLKTGDHVTVKYLPKSGYILYITETDRNTADIE